MKKVMNRNWINYIDTDLIDIYPIQFANCDRLQNNDSVYIFDEVGSGKTISSGLMALDYLFNNQNEKVLIITINALVKKDHGEYGQFLTDWYEKLPFSSLKFKDRIDIVNNHHSSFRETAEYGLVIIDEAHLFLNEKTERHQNLIKNIKAKKVVFLTATPIKEQKSDLNIYVKIAEQLMEKNEGDLTRDWIDAISTAGKKEDQVICSTFDVNFPVTRYFKDTIMALNVKGHEKTRRRLLPKLWYYNKDETKIEAMIKEIKQKYHKDHKNRFIIFTRLVEKEAVEIGKYLNQAKISKYSPLKDGEFTYYIVTGENSYELAKFSKNKDLPTILILTYQTAEQGVNLPGYNHVINYHIPPFPSSLEQRFGRIDRMGKNGSIFSNINMCFLVSKDRYDRNTANFYIAVSTYMRTLISYLPSKNTILSEEVIEQHDSAKPMLVEYIEKIRSLTKSDDEIVQVRGYYIKCKKQMELMENKLDDSIYKLDFVSDSELVEFCIDYDIFDIKKFDCKQTEIKQKIEEKLLEIERILENDDIHKNLALKIVNESEDEIGDKVFYGKNKEWDFNKEDFNKEDWNEFEENVSFLDAIECCAENIKTKSVNYRNYNKLFNESIKMPLLFAKYRKVANVYFEEEFNENRLENIFPVKGYYDLYLNENIFDEGDITPEDKELLLSKIDDFTETLPFFKMCMKFKERLHLLSFTKEGFERVKADFNVFTSALGGLKYIDFGLSDEFVDKYWKEYIEYSGFKEHYLKFFYIRSDSRGVVKALNWFKLAYHFTRREMSCFADVKSGEHNKDVTTFYEKKSRIVKWIIRNYSKYENACKTQSIMCSEDESSKLTNTSEIITKYGKKINELDDINNEIRKFKNSKSLFYKLIFTDKNNVRKHYKEICQNIPKKYELYLNDIWTQGIYAELYEERIEQNGLERYWIEILRLPKEIFIKCFSVKISNYYTDYLLFDCLL